MEARVEVASAGRVLDQSEAEALKLTLEGGGGARVADLVCSLQRQQPHCMNGINGQEAPMHRYHHSFSGNTAPMA